MGKVAMNQSLQVGVELVQGERMKVSVATYFRGRLLGILLCAVVGVLLGSGYWAGVLLDLENRPEWRRVSSFLQQDKSTERHSVSRVVDVITSVETSISESVEFHSLRLIQGSTTTVVRPSEVPWLARNRYLASANERWRDTVISHPGSP
jgi:hypothetical protein